MRSLAWAWGGFVAAMAIGAACGSPAGSDCLTGSAGCSCTVGGGCDPGLTCISATCVDVSSATSDGGPGPGDDAMDDAPPMSTSDSGTADASDDGIKLDVGPAADVPGGDCAQTGCTKVDMLFAIDSSLSMIEEIDALSGVTGFAQIVAALEGLNCGGIEYRIGLTNDNDGGFIGAMGHDWFDSNELTAEEITNAFNAAAGTVLGSGGTALGCEHVLSSSVSTLALDTTGFSRPDALLVLVLLTDVDDYGAYDQMGAGGPCDGMLCTEPVQPVQTILTNLTTLKGGDPASVAAIVVAGDPANTEGTNLCQQQASCCGGGFECTQALHGTRLYEFASMLPGTNGVTVDICDGADQLPAAIETALGGDIDLACQTYEPEG